jgi:7-cyano-7-deazaguanine synthase in queuosine biosynthesis
MRTAGLRIENRVKNFTLLPILSCYPAWMVSKRCEKKLFFQSIPSAFITLMQYFTPKKQLQRISLPHPLVEMRSACWTIASQAHLHFTNACRRCHAPPREAGKCGFCPVCRQLHNYGKSYF